MSTAANHKQPKRADAEFIERLASHYVPPPLTPNQRTVSHLALAARLEKRRQRRVLFVPALATATVAALALVFSLDGRFRLEPSEPPVRPPPLQPSESGRRPDSWEYQLLTVQLIDDEEEQHSLLPDDYAAIKSAC